MYKFQNQLQEDGVYSLQFLSVATNVDSFGITRHEHKLIFQMSSKVQIMESGHVAGDGYDFVPISEIYSGNYNKDYLVGK